MPPPPKLSAVVACLEEIVTGLDARLLTGEHAAELVGLFAKAERLCHAGKALCARRGDESRAWRQAGYRSAADWLAATSGTSTGQAVATLETAQHLDGALEATRQAFQAGELSAAQAAEVAAAAAADPSAEERLLAAAAYTPLPRLRDQCRRVRAAALRQGHADVYERIRAGRYLRSWTDAEGASCGQWRLTPDAGATFLAALDARAEEIFAKARKAGRREPPEAYRADALVSLVERPATKPSVTMHIRVDHATWVRGWAEPGETCEIVGVGPVPVGVVRRMACDAVWRALVTDGVDVSRVSNTQRYVSPALRAALIERDPMCVNPRCGATKGLEIHHYGTAFADGGEVSLKNCARVCGFDHYLLTCCGYRLVGGPGSWRMIGPGEGHGDGNGDGAGGRGPPEETRSGAPVRSL